MPAERVMYALAVLTSGHRRLRAYPCAPRVATAVTTDAHMRRGSPSNAEHRTVRGSLGWPQPNRSDRARPTPRAGAPQVVEFTEPNLAGRSVRRHPDRHVIQDPVSTSYHGVSPAGPTGRMVDPSAETAGDHSPELAPLGPLWRVTPQQSQMSGGMGLLPCPASRHPDPGAVGSAHPRPRSAASKGQPAQRGACEVHERPTGGKVVLDRKSCSSLLHGNARVPRHCSHYVRISEHV